MKNIKSIVSQVGTFIVFGLFYYILEILYRGYSHI